MKDSAINVTKGEDIFTENYSTLLKEVKNHLSKWRNNHVHGKLNVLRCQYSPVLSRDSMQCLPKVTFAGFSKKCLFMGEGEPPSTGLPSKCLQWPDWAKPNLGAWNSIQVSHMGGKNPVV